MGETNIVTNFIQVKFLLAKTKIFLKKDLCMLSAKDGSNADQVLLMAYFTQQKAENERRKFRLKYPRKQQ